MNTNKSTRASSRRKNLRTAKLLHAVNSHPVDLSDVEELIEQVIKHKTDWIFAQERLRQARRSFDLAWFTTAACAFIGISGVMLMMAGKTDKTLLGSATAVSGAGATVYCLRLAKDANDRFDRIAPKD